MHRFIYFFGLLIALLYSCQKDVTLDLRPESGNLLIVEASMIDIDTTQVIRLSLTNDFYNEVPIMVTDAEVTVFINNIPYEFTQSSSLDSAGYYIYNSSWGFNPGDVLRLRVLYNDEEYTAQSVALANITLDSISFSVNPFSEFFGDGGTYDINAHFDYSNRTKGELHFLFNYYANGELKSVTPSDKFAAPDENLEDYVSVAVQDFNLSLTGIESGDTITLEVLSIGKENYEFYLIFFNQTSLSGNPFAGPPPANIPTNISNGARGFFQASIVERRSRVFIMD
jgi:hypothetical protein